MTIISKLRQPFIRLANRRQQNVFKQNIRKSSHSNTIEIEPSIAPEIIFFDRFHLFTCFAAIPMILFGTYMSVVYGDAILADTPENYEPEDWECERSPISRLLARYFYYDSAYHHEYKIAQMAREADSRMVKMVISKVKEVQYQNKDYRAWYYQPISDAEEDRISRLKRDEQYHYMNVAQIQDMQFEDVPRK